MRVIRETTDLIVAGGGTAGHTAAIQAGRAGIKVSVIEASSMMGGSMTDGGMNMPAYFYNAHEPVALGIGWELFKKSRKIEGLKIPAFETLKPVDNPGYYGYINVPVYATIAEQETLKAGVDIHYHEFIGEVKADGDYWEVISYTRGIKRITRCKEIIDCTGDADISRALGLEVDYAAKRQPGTLQYKFEGIDMEQVWEGEVQRIYDDAIARGELEKGDFAYFGILPFRYYLQHGGHNGTHIYGCDTSDGAGQTHSNILGREKMLRMYDFVRKNIPGAERVVLKTMYNRAISRESYRVRGEYQVTAKDYSNAVSYPDTVCNAFNYIDMHNEENGCEETFLESDKLVPKVPFRALIPKNSRRITVAGRILSADRVALAGIRAQCSCMAMGQAMGAAAALAIKSGQASRDIPARDIVAMTVEHGAVPVF